MANGDYKVVVDSHSRREQQLKEEAEFLEKYRKEVDGLKTLSEEDLKEILPESNADVFAAGPGDVIEQEQRVALILNDPDLYHPDDGVKVELIHISTEVGDEGMDADAVDVFMTLSRHAVPNFLLKVLTSEEELRTLELHGLKDDLVVMSFQMSGCTVAHLNFHSWGGDWVLCWRKS